MEEILDTDKVGSDSGLVITPQMKTELIKTVKWTKFLAILGFVGIGLMVLASFALLAVPARGFNGEQTSQMAIAYIFMGAIYFFPLYYLLKFSTNAKNGLEKSDQLSLNEGFQFLRKHYQFIGVFTIVIISLYVVGILILIAFSGDKLF